MTWKPLIAKVEWLVAVASSVATMPPPYGPATFVVLTAIAAYFLIDRQDRANVAGLKAKRPQENRLPVQIYPQAKKL
jgi:hypothetical protein